jgi:hypothetical protein
LTWLIVARTSSGILLIGRKSSCSLNNGAIFIERHAGEFIKDTIAYEIKAFELKRFLTAT